MSAANPSFSDCCGVLTASFQYDAVGRRKSKTVNGTTTYFLYDGLNVVQELNSTTPTANLLTSLGIDETLQRTDAAGARSFLTDGLGSTLALTDSAGLVQGEYTYDPFGKTTASGVASTNAFKYTGREDDGTGLYYYRARYYHPGLQRFISEDPIGFEGGDVNLYGYVGNSPVNYVDPSGLNPAAIAAWCATNPACAGLAIGTAHILGQILKGCLLTKGKDNAPQHGGPPRNAAGNAYAPDPEAEGPHSTFGPHIGSDGQPYQQGATFGANGEFQGRTDVTDHGRPDVPGHTIPHHHPGPTGIGGPATPGPVPYP
jgi:RHS repeat-associated protein